jgi:oligoribonuclease
MQGNRMIWVDLETTGLDANEHIPLEVGLAITDRFGNIEAENSWLIHEGTFEWRRKLEEGASHPIVGPMHTSSGLWEELARHKAIIPSRYGADRLMAEWLDENNFPEGTFPMCGSSVGSLDRPFITNHFPRLIKYFHYRSIDISSVKELCKLHAPETWEKYNELTKEDIGGHRVLSDIHYSIREYQFYLKYFLKVEDL